MKKPFLCLLWVVAGLCVAGVREASAQTVAPSPTPPAAFQYVETGVTHEALTNNYGTWDSQYLRFTNRGAQNTTIYAQAESVNRYGKQDSEFTAGAYFPLSRQFLANVEASASGTHNVLPSSIISAGIQYNSGGGWFEGLAARQTQYPAGTVNSTIFSLERYWGAYRMSYRLTVASLAGTGASSEHALTLDRYYGAGSYVGATYVTGKEIDNFGLPVLATSAVEGFTIAGRHWMNRTWGLVYGYSWLTQGSLYSKTGGNLGVDYRF